MPDTLALWHSEHVNFARLLNLLDDQVARIRKHDAAMTKTIDTLAQQHRKLKVAGESLVRYLDDIINGSIESRATVEAAAREYVDTLREHIRLEETDVLPVAGRLLTNQDWAAVHAAIGHVEDPLFGKHPQSRYAALQSRIARNAKAGQRPGAAAG